jgi:hypothetical protein
MNKQLRKGHRMVWMAWAVLLPVGILFSWLVIPGQPPVKLLENEPAPLLPVIIQTSTSPEYTINLRSDADSSEWQLEWINKRILKVPSAVIYQLRGENASFRPGNSELIGRIEAQGRYVFSLANGSPPGKQIDLVLYDFIHNNIIANIQLQYLK